MKDDDATFARRMGAPRDLEALDDTPKFLRLLDISVDTNTTCSNNIQHVIEASSGGFFMAGSISCAPIASPDDYSWYPLVGRLTEDGEVLWVKSLEYGGFNDWAVHCLKGIQEIGNGGILLVGMLDPVGSSSSYSNLIIGKLDDQGRAVWAKILDEESSRAMGRLTISRLEKTSDGGFILVGSSDSDSSLHDIFVTKLKANAAASWVRLMDYSSDQKAYDIREIKDGGFILAGFNDLTNSALLMKISETGGLLWAKNVGEITRTKFSYCQANSVVEITEGGFLFVGEVGYLGNSAVNALIVKLDVNGNLSWAKTLENPDTANWWTQGYKVVGSSDGGFVLLGRYGRELLSKLVFQFWCFS